MAWTSIKAGFANKKHLRQHQYDVHVNPTRGVCDVRVHVLKCRRVYLGIPGASFRVNVAAIAQFAVVLLRGLLLRHG